MTDFENGLTVDEYFELADRLGELSDLHEGETRFLAQVSRMESDGGKIPLHCKTLLQGLAEKYREELS